MVGRFSTVLASALFAILPVAALAQLTPGTTLVGTIDQNLSSNHARVGQPITISNAHSTNFEVNTRSGNIYHVQGYASQVAVKTKSNALKEVGGAAAGALVGGLLGHGVGAILGAGGGALYAKNSRENVSISQGSSISVQIVQSRRQSKY
jgi:hypothetical protein